MKGFTNLEQKESMLELIKTKLTVRITLESFIYHIIVRVGGGYLSIDEFLD